MLDCFFDLIDNRDKKPTCFSSPILCSCDDVLSRDDERNGLLLYGCWYEVACLCECEYDIFLKFELDKVFVFCCFDILYYWISYLCLLS